jgi:hypothetical protein
MPGTREEQSISSGQLEFVKKHLQVCRVYNRSRDVATREKEFK